MKDNTFGYIFNLQKIVENTILGNVSTAQNMDITGLV